MKINFLFFNYTICSGKELNPSELIKNYNYIDGRSELLIRSPTRLYINKSALSKRSKIDLRPPLEGGFVGGFFFEFDQRFSKRTKPILQMLRWG